MITENFEESGLNDDTSSSEDNSVTGTNSPSDDQKRQIAAWVNEGMGLSDIQKKINDDFGIVMTYMDVRFLVDDLNLDLIDEEDEKEDVEKDEGSDAAGTPPSAEDPLDDSAGGVQVELDTVTPPGAMASGSVTFSDGQHKKWTLDQFGRLGLTGGEEGYKPSDEDVMEFQKQLDSALRGKGF
jgi:hypothetical protein